MLVPDINPMNSPGIAFCRRRSVRRRGSDLTQQRQSFGHRLRYCFESRAVLGS
jgi:hypothetical protein